MFSDNHFESPTILSQLMGHSTLQMTSRYVANNTDAHVQANQDLAKKVMSFIQTPGQSNTMESAGTVCKIETKPVAKPVADHGAGGNARKGKNAGSNGSACDYVPCFVSHSSTMQGMLRPLVSTGLPCVARRAKHGGPYWIFCQRQIRLRRRTSGFY